jgi:probable rRNA maturation factor
LSEKKERHGGLVFELVLNGQKATKEAKLRGHSAEAEVALYVIHGLLHNLGFNDVGPEEAAKMHDTEDQILKRFGFGLIYNS